MKRILFIKLTSLGDLIHALPAFTDAISVYPNLKIDWVVDENFAEVATWHTAIDQIFTTNHRQWRKGLFSAIRPIRKLIHTIRKTDYDLIIDGQGNFKSALLSLFLHAPTAGYDRHSIREPIASFGYQKKFPVSLKIHAIERLRRLFAQSLNYSLPLTSPHFSINRTQLTPPPLHLPENFLIFIHSAAWKTKIWPEEHGLKLMQLLTEKGYSILLPWGTSEEKERAHRLAINDQVQVLPKLTLSEIGSIIARAKGCISMDTGLSHLSAALGIPCLTLYGATDSGIIGASGKNQLHLQAKLPCAPCNKKQCRFTTMSPPCLIQLTPEAVFHRFSQILCCEKQASDTCSKSYEHYIEK